MCYLDSVLNDFGSLFYYNCVILPKKLYHFWLAVYCGRKYVAQDFKSLNKIKIIRGGGGGGGGRNILGIIIDSRINVSECTTKFGSALSTRM